MTSAVLLISRWKRPDEPLGEGKKLFPMGNLLRCFL
jgi:hypothetical protein